MGDYRTTTGEAPPMPAPVRRRRRRRWMAVSSLLLAGAAAGGYFIRVPRVVWASGYIATESYAEIRPTVDGTIAEYRARSGDRIEQGDLLVRLDDTEARAALEEARSRLRQLEAEVERRKADAADRRRRMEHETAVARLRLRSIEARLERQRELQSRGLAAAATVEDLVLQRELATAELQALLDRDLTLPEREIEALRFEAAAAAESVARLEALWKRRWITAPISGVVVRYEFVVGDPVRPDTVLYEIFGGEPRLLKVRVDERHATRVAAGQRYEARLKPYGGWRDRRFEGRVEALKYVISTEGPRTYRTVYCTFDPGGLNVPAGTTAEVRIFVGRVRLWAWLLGLD